MAYVAFGAFTIIHGDKGIQRAAGKCVSADWNEQYVGIS